MSDKIKCLLCLGTGKISETVSNDPPSYNYGSGDGCDYTDPSTGYPMGYEPYYEIEKTCPKCNGKGMLDKL